tara:strand:+ start:211 stop:1635 length:1425 start_codon:yes stop_codon:yes gene_type:complete
MIKLSQLNRENLSKKIVEGAVLIHGNNTVYRNNDVAFDFRQNSNFHYLTSWPEPFAHAVIIINNKKPELYLFVQDRNIEMETWDGKRFGPDGAKKYFGAADAFVYEDFETIAPKLLSGVENIYCDYSSNNFEKFDKKVIDLASSYDQRGSSFGEATINSLSPILSELRLIKNSDEITYLKNACDITVEGHKVAMQFTKKNMFEYQIEAEMEKTFYDLGAERLGYPSIVASGDNSCILHYSTNRDKVANDGLILIDAGAEYNMYSSDVTRTFPINGKFSSPQKDIYEEVLKAQLLGINNVNTSNTMSGIHELTVASISQSLVDLGLVPMGVDETVSMMHYFEFFMHGTGHWLGLDVHDAGSTEEKNKPRKLKPGMVTTVEPGIYIRPNKPEIEFKLLERDPKEIRERRKQLGMEKATILENEELKDAKSIKHKIPKDLLGIGIRIEDDIVCTEEDPINLTSGAPKTIEDIEAICN